MNLDLCPHCNAEGDPIQAINCKPVKWLCPDCGTKWTEQGVFVEEQEKEPVSL